MILTIRVMGIAMGNSEHFDYHVMTVAELIGPLNDYEKKQAPSELYVSRYPNLVNVPRVSIVGTRNPSSEGIETTRLIVERLVDAGVVIVSGLAKGVDTVAHSTAILRNGKTVAVLGTPLDVVYPRENRLLQEKIAKDHLLISQYNFGSRTVKSNFPSRNRTMALISHATIIVEAGESSGTQHQGWEAIRIGRPLFIVEDIVAKKNVGWAKSMLDYGAQLLNPKDIELVLDVLPFYGEYLNNVTL